MLSGKLIHNAVPSTLSDREVELVDFFQKAPIALHWLSGTGHVIWANDIEMQTLGYTADEYIGHSITEVDYIIDIQPLKRCLYLFFFD